MKGPTRIPLVFLLLVTACAGKVDYVRPTPPEKLSNSKVIEKPREVVWNAAVPALGKQFFVINNMDKGSGFINLSYSGDPEQYVDCGQVTSYVKNARGERTYQFPASRAEQSYEVMTSNLFRVDRKMALEGRMNLVFEEITPSSTRVTATTRYVLTRTVRVTDVNARADTTSETINFNSGSGASFAPKSDGRATECVSTGRFESEILSAIN
ncbi:MAG TPA: hypothetical protein PLZ79_07595 [Burkholderiales bacterium]|nr:hypothetical protein [Betaproteobacteria bacterium]HQR53120.1 hypothetical protein [Burkholderiales bacterium]